MRIKVGQRQTVNHELKGAMALVGVLTHTRQVSTKLNFDGMCGKCKTPVKTSLKEEVKTGKIWLEGLDKCPNCGYQLSSPDVPFTPLSQEAIETYFGKY